MESCFLCPRTESVTPCSDCLTIAYCPHHEKYHRGDQGCYPYNVEEKEGVGRLLVATRDIEPGDIIFKERELVVGPSKGTEPVCLGCGGVVTCLVRCDGCDWPVCSATCPQIANHTQAECDMIAPSGPGISKDDSSSWQVYDAIMPLRVLLLARVERDYMLLFMDHGEDKQGRQDALAVVATVREAWGEEQFSSDLILRVSGILDINTVEHRVPDSPSSRGFLPITSLASHSCVSNSFKDKTEPGWVTTRAKIHIR